MLPTIIFFLALLLSSLQLIGLILRAGNPFDEYTESSKIASNALIMFINCILWSYLFYLLH